MAELKLQQEAALLQLEEKRQAAITRREQERKETEAHNYAFRQRHDTAALVIQCYWRGTRSRKFCVKLRKTVEERRLRAAEFERQLQEQERVRQEEARTRAKEEAALIAAKLEQFSAATQIEQMRLAAVFILLHRFCSFYFADFV